MSKAPAIFALIAVLTLQAASRPPQDEPRKQPPPDFKGDNCTWFPDGDYADCCLAHDKEYFVGGTKAERKASDKRLQQCVRSKGHKYLSKMMYLGVRIGGVPWLPTKFRWGFGQTKPRK
jgi:hypothetical protein